MMERKAGNLDLPLTKFQQGAALDEELIKAEPGNPLWEGFVAPAYLNIAEILDQLNRPKEALVYYQQFQEVSERSPSAGRDRRRRERSTPRPRNWSATIPRGCPRSTPIAARCKSGAG